MQDFLTDFERYFEVVPAATPELITEGQQLRYQVYCCERNILNSHQYPDGVEKDEHDNQSLHSLLRHRPSGCLTATVRLILLEPNDRNRSLPIEQRLEYPLLYRGKDIRRLPRISLSEISRFAVSKKFRMRAGDGELAYALPRESDRRTKSSNAVSIDRRRNNDRRQYPHISMGLMKAILQMSVAQGVQYWLAAMDPPFIRLLTRFGMHFHPLGPKVEYHGQRQPCVVNVKTFLDRVYRQHREVWNFITDNGRVNL